MKLGGYRRDGTLRVLIPGGMTILLHGEIASPPLDDREADAYGPWVEPDTTLTWQERQEIGKRLDRARTVPLHALSMPSGEFTSRSVPSGAGLLARLDAITPLDLGGAGSGNFGHSGRPGEEGGSGGGSNSGGSKNPASGNHAGSKKPSSGDFGHAGRAAGPASTIAEASDGLKRGMTAKGFGSLFPKKVPGEAVPVAPAKNPSSGNFAHAGRAAGPAGQEAEAKSPIPNPANIPGLESADEPRPASAHAGRASGPAGPKRSTKRLTLEYSIDDSEGEERKPVSEVAQPEQPEHLKPMEKRS